MKKIIFCVGLVTALLGVLWLLQGLGIVHIRSFLCFADCAPIQGASTTWAVIGAIALALGGTAMFFAFMRRAV